MDEGIQPPAKRPWRVMRRNSRRAGDLVKLLRDADVSLRGRPITGRRLEDLSRDGLLPPDDAPTERVVAYFQALDALDYGQGKSADETSCRLLARRFGTERVRLVLATGIEAWTQDDHKYTWDQLSSMKGIGPVFKQILDACVNVPIGGRETYNGELLRETPDARKAGFMGSMAEAGSGEPVNDPELVNDVARQVPPNPEHYERLSMPEEVEAAESIANAMGVALKRAPEIVASESLATLATWAVIVKAIISLFSVPNFDAREHEVLAAQLTPFFLAFFQVMIQEGWGIDQSKLQALHAQSEGTLPAY